MNSAYFENGGLRNARITVVSTVNDVYFCYFTDMPGQKFSGKALCLYYRPGRNRANSSRIMSVCEAEKEWGFLEDVRSLEEVPLSFQDFILRHYEKVFGKFTD